MDHIGVHCCREPVRNDDRRPPDCQFAKAREPVGFGPGIERARRFIENNNWSTSQKSASECDALPLTDAQFSATGEPTTQECLLLLRQTRNSLFSARGSKRVLN